MVPARDGGLCRVKLPGGRLSAAQARAIARAVRQGAGGVLELTNRGNLQIRGVRDPALPQTLLAAGLGSPDAAADDRSNLLLSPAAGRDPQALLDVRPLAGRLLALLRNGAGLHALAPKFALQLDGGERLTRLGHPHDLWLAAVPGAPSRLAFGLAGSPADAPLGALPLAQAEVFVGTLLRLFLQLAGPAQTRMRQLLGEVPVAEFLAQLAARLPFALQPPPALRRAPLPDTAPLGLVAQRQAGLMMVIVNAPLGRLRVDQLEALAALAEGDAGGELHLTPWQGLLLPDVPRARAAGTLDELCALGLLGDARAPLAALLACTGSAGCARAHADTKADARLLAERLTRVPAQVHLSGCPRGCAAGHVAPYTLLAQPGGRYRLYRREPASPGFGRMLGEDLDLDQAARRLTQETAR